MTYSYNDYFQHESSDWNVLKFFQHRGLDRKKLVKLLINQNQDASQSVKNNIRLLLSEDSYAVVTGQQLGIFGGPLYTLYKLLDTVYYAQRLKTAYPHKNFIPVFWLESEDSDMQEAGTFHYLEGNQSRKWTYQRPGKAPVSDTQIDEQIQSAKAIFHDRHFNINDNWLASFRSFYAELFNHYGVVAFFSNQEDVYQACQDFWSLILRQHQEISQTIRSRNLDLIKRFQSLQVPVADNDSFLFQIWQGERIKLSQINETKGRLSPNVLLRPLYQDFIFPTILTVLGKAELRYQMQMQDLYPFINRSVPKRVLRHSFFLINPKAKRLLKNYRLKIPLELTDFDTKMSELVNNLDFDSLEKMKESRSKTNEEFFAQIKAIPLKESESQHKSLAGFEQRLKKLEDQFYLKLKRLKKREIEDQRQHLTYLQEIFYPNGEWQERQFGVYQFAESPLQLAQELFPFYDENPWQVKWLEIK